MNKKLIFFMAVSVFGAIVFFKSPLVDTVSAGCTDKNTVNLPASPRVVRAGSKATVSWFQTEGNEANVYYKEVGSINWTHAVRDIKLEGNQKHFASVRINNLKSNLRYIFGIQQKYGCAGGQIINAVITDLTKNDLFTYRTPKFGYEITFDRQIWQVKDMGKVLETNDFISNKELNDLFFFLKEDSPDKDYKNKTSILFSAALDNDALPNIKEIIKQKNPDLEGDDLEFLAKWNEDYIKNDKTKQFIRKERIKRGEKDVYKLVIKEKVFGEETEYFEYLFIVNGRYYSFDARYPKISDSGKLAEKLIDSFTFFYPEKN